MSLFSNNFVFSSRSEDLIEELSARSFHFLRNKEILGDFFSQKSILVTGAGGSIGSEICRQLGFLNPSEIILVDNNEYFLWKIRIELSEKFPSLKITPYLADVTSLTRMEKIFSQTNPKIIFHAAALKHVKIVEENPCEGFLTNIIGTKILSKLAVLYEVENFIFLSTDKAVKPKSCMGASKKIAELWLQHLNEKPSKTFFAILRFGNVLGSAGSVIPLFEHQIAQGGPITLTHKEAKRYFITCEEAVFSLLQAALVSTKYPQKEPFFILDMGKPVHIIDVANFLISKVKKEIGQNIQINITGLEKGEKINEDLLNPGEKMTPILGTNLFHISFSRAFKLPEEIDKKILHIEEASRKSDPDRLLKQVPQILPDFPFL
ncbi:NAD-dependent epimerase/dehydratase family protein [Acetobacteraceae bacterium]|nr:NAD-dependent epimerase/dehydratase family protein [Acetobacteraceae bacterium]